MKRLFIVALLALTVTASRAANFQYNVTLDGPTEPSTSTGIGFGLVTYNDVLHTLALQLTFSGLVQTGTGTTVSHIHAATAAPLTGTASVATTSTGFANFPAGVRSGGYTNTLDLTQASSFNASFITANGGTVTTAEAALAAAMATGKAYWNLHSSTFGGGEIRGFLVAVPEPTTLALGGFVLLGLLARRGFRRRDS